MTNKTYKREFYLTAADCNAQFELPLWTLGQNIVEVATDHANLIGVGYKRLQEDGNAWVLLRLRLETARMPRVHERYLITTWVAAFNRRFSERDFEISIVDDNGSVREIIGHVHTVWTVINSTTRQAASLDGLGALDEMVSERPDVTFGRSQRVRPADFAETAPCVDDYTVAVSDIDTNRHLTAMRYVQLMLNCKDLDFYDANTLTSFEIAYSNEARYGDSITSRIKPLDNPGSAAILLTRGAEPLSLATMEWQPRCNEE